MQRLRLLRLRGDTGLHLVLVWHTPQRVRLGAVPLTGLPHRITDDLGEVTARLARSRHDTGRRWCTRSRRCPTATPPFLSDAAAVLSHPEYSRVVAVHARAADATTRRLTEHGDAPGRAKRFGWLGPDNTGLAERMLEALHPPHAYLRTLHEKRPPGAIRDWCTAVGLYRFLGDLVADSPGRKHTITRLRGAQAAFERHALRLALPSNLAYTVSPGLTTTPITDHVIARIRARTANPAHAVALVTLHRRGRCCTPPLSSRKPETISPANCSPTESEPG